MSRSWSSAHDWKSCKGQKLFESSNLSISAKNNSRPFGRLLFFNAGWRDSNQYRTSQRDVHLPVRTLADTSVFPLEKRKRIFSISAKKNSPPSGGLFFFYAGWRDSNQYRTSQRDVHLPVRTLADTSVFPLEKRKRIFSISARKKHLLSQVLFSRKSTLRVGEISCGCEILASLG